MVDVLTNFKGMSAFAMLHKEFPIKRLLKCYPKDLKYPAVAILANRFGRKWGNLKTFCNAQTKQFAVEVHFMSGPARRNGKQEKFDLWRGMPVAELNYRLEKGTLPYLAAHIKTLRLNLEDCLRNCPKATVFICPELEDNLTNEAFRKLLQAFKKEFAVWTNRPRWVRSPCTGGNELLRGVLLERHGRTIYPCKVYNPDGVSVAFHDGEDYFDTMTMDTLRKYFAKHSAARLRFIWPAYMQGVGSSGSFNYPSILGRDYIVTDNAIVYSNKILSEI